MFNFTRGVYLIQCPPGDVPANRVSFSAENSGTGLYLFRLYSGTGLYFLGLFFRDRSDCCKKSTKDSENFSEAFLLFN